MEGAAARVETWVTCTHQLPLQSRASCAQLRAGLSLVMCLVTRVLRSTFVQPGIVYCDGCALVCTFANVPCNIMGLPPAGCPATLCSYSAAGCDVQAYAHPRGTDEWIGLSGADGMLAGGGGWVLRWNCQRRGAGCRGTPPKSAAAAHTCAAPCIPCRWACFLCERAAV